MGAASSSDVNEDDGNEDAEADFLAAVREFHLARGESRLWDMLTWYAAMKECCDEADYAAAASGLEDSDGVGARATVVRHELLNDCERLAGGEASKALVALAAARKGADKIDKAKAKAKKAEIKAESKRIKATCEKLGLLALKSDRSSEAPASADPAVGGLRREGGGSQSGQVVPMSARREGALEALDEACHRALAALAEGRGAEAFESVREEFDRCTVLGAVQDATASCCKLIRRGVGRAMDAATAPLEAREATRRQLAKMHRRNGLKPDLRSCAAAGGEVQLDDSDNPQPFYTAMAHVLSRASVALVEVDFLAQRLDSLGGNSPSCSVAPTSPTQPPSTAVSDLMWNVAQDASSRTRTVLQHFRDEIGLDALHAQCVAWLRDLEGGKGGAPSLGHRSRTSCEDNGCDASPPGIQGSLLELGRLDAALEDVTELLALTHRFLAFLDSSQLHLNKRFRVAELPLFSDSLGLAAQYVDVETAYCLYCLRKAISQSSHMEVSRGVHMASLAEDCFFVLRDKVLDRALATMSGQAILAISSRIVEALDTTASEPCLFREVSSLPEAPVDVLLVMEAAEAFRQHTMRRRSEDASNMSAGSGRHATKSAAGAGSRANAAPVARNENSSDRKLGSNDGLGGADGPLSSPPPSSSSSSGLEGLVAGLAQQMDDDLTGLDEADTARLIALVVATNSADACAVSVGHLRSHMGAAVYECLGQSLAQKLSQTSLLDLRRVANEYSELRASFLELLVEGYLETPLDTLHRALQRRSFVLDSFGKIVRGSQVQVGAAGVPARHEISGLLGAVSGFVAKTQAGQSLQPTRQDLTTPLVDLFREHVLDSFAFVSLHARLTPVALSALVDMVTARVAAMVSRLFTGGSHTVSEWGALGLQREVRDLEQRLLLVLSAADPGRSVRHLEQLERIVLIVNLDRPADLALYSAADDSMTESDVRAVLAARFGAQAASLAKIPTK